MTIKIVYGDYCRKLDQRCDDNCPDRKKECAHRVRWEDLEQTDIMNNGIKK